MDRYSQCEAEVTAHTSQSLTALGTLYTLRPPVWHHLCLMQPGHGVSSPCCCKPCFISHDYSINNTHHVVCCGGLCVYAQGQVVFSCTKVFTQLRASFFSLGPPQWLSGFGSLAACELLNCDPAFSFPTSPHVFTSFGLHTFGIL